MRDGTTYHMHPFFLASQLFKFVWANVDKGSEVTMVRTEEKWQSSLLISVLKNGL